MMKRNIAISSILLVLAGLGGCVVSKDEYDSLATKNKKLESQVESQRTELSRREVKQDAQRNSTTSQPTTGSSDDMSQVYSGTILADREAEIAKLKKELDTVKTNAAADRKSADAEIAKLQSRCKTLEAEIKTLRGQTTDAATKPAMQSATPTTGPSSPSGKTSSGSSYDQLLEEVRNRRFASESTTTAPAVPSSRPTTPTTAPASRSAAPARDSATPQATTKPAAAADANPGNIISSEIYKLRQDLAVATELNKALQARYLTLARRHQGLLYQLASLQQAKTN